MERNAPYSSIESDCNHYIPSIYVHAGIVRKSKLRKKQLVPQGIIAHFSLNFHPI